MTVPPLPTAARSQGTALPEAPPPGGEASTFDGFSVIIPALNEEPAIGLVLDRTHEVLTAHGRPYEIIVVDDGSTDGTGQVASQRPGVRIIRHPANAGYGASLRDGVMAAQYNWIVITDADGTYPIEELPDLLRWAHEYDMVVGARTGAEYRGSLLKYPARIAFGALCSFVTGMAIPDVNSGLRIMRRDLVVAFADTLSRGMSFTTTITLAMLSNGYFVKYVPISYHKRIGRSKVRYLRDTLRMAQIIVQAITYYNPLKLFLVLAMLSVLLGLLGVAVGWLLGTAALWVTGAVYLAAALPLFGLGLIADLIRHQRERPLPPTLAQQALTRAQPTHERT